MKTSTLSGFTVGIITISATIMVLQLTTPNADTWASLITEWKTFVAHFNSFFLIFILWYSHAKEFSRIESISSDIVIYTGLWLIFMAIIPFSTSWVEEYPNGTIPEVFFSILIFIVIAISNIIQRCLKNEYPNVNFSTRADLKFRLPIYLGIAIALINSFLFPIFNPLVYLIIVIYMTVLIVKTKTKDIRIF